MAGGHPRFHPHNDCRPLDRSIVFKCVRNLLLTTAVTWAFSVRIHRVTQDHPYISRKTTGPLRTERAAVQGSEAVVQDLGYW